MRDEKCSLIVCANRAMEEGERHEAYALFARAAELEEARFSRDGQVAAVLSAVHCWIGAREYDRALRVAIEALERVAKEGGGE